MDVRAWRNAAPNGVGHIACAQSTTKSAAAMESFQRPTRENEVPAARLGCVYEGSLLFERWQKRCQRF